MKQMFNLTWEKTKKGSVDCAKQHELNLQSTLHSISFIFLLYLFLPSFPSLTRVLPFLKKLLPIDEIALPFQILHFSSRCSKLRKLC